MTFFNSIKMCYMKSFDFKGRASKSEYWWFWLVQVPITFIALGALGLGTPKSLMYCLECF